MGHPPATARTVTAGAVSAVLFAAIAFGVHPDVHAAPGTAAAPAGPLTAAPALAAADASAGSDLRFVDIPGDGGTTLKANVTTPDGGRDGGRHPLVVLPTSWGTPQIQYLLQARKLADAGYVVVGYNVRGFWQSGGRIEVAGPPDVADARKVIDWALEHTPADPEHVGMAGMSYAAGISLLAAGEDPRIRAVVAMSGWADLNASIYGNRTQHAQAAGLLGGVGELTGRPSDEFRRILKHFLSSDLGHEKEFTDWGRKRSAAARLDRINANGAAIMLGNAWGDTVFPPNQYADFFEKLTGPKRLEFRPGDHGTPEAGGLFGLPNDTWDHARRWLDHHLRGEDNGIDREQPVQLLPRSGGEYEGYPSWAAVPSRTATLPLEGTQRIRTDLDSGANGGLVLLSGLLDRFLGLPPTVSVPRLPRDLAAVWQSEPYASPQRLRGTVRLHTTVTGTASSGTAMAYLYDVGPGGTGKLITNAPYTFHDKAPGTPFGVDLELNSTAYDLPAGHRLALVVDTVDPLYLEHNPGGARLAFSSPANDPSRLEIPLRDR